MRFILIIGVIGVLASCRSAKNIQTAITKKDTVVVVADSNIKKPDSSQIIKGILNEVLSKKISFNTFNAKINVDYRGADGKHYDVNTNLRMYKDSAIWISVNAVLGIEAMRAMITKDSVKLIDKLNKTYTAKSIDYLQEVTELPLDLKTLQDLIVGNVVYLDTNNIISYSGDANAISILSINKWFKNLITLNQQDRTIQRIKLDDADITRNRTADLSYSEYETKKGPLFPTKRNIIVAEKSRLEIKLDFKNYDFNGEVSFPFTLPKNYRHI